VVALADRVRLQRKPGLRALDDGPLLPHPELGDPAPVDGRLGQRVKATPVGYDRVYVRLGKDTFDYPGFMHALKLGRSFSTNGPILDLEVDGRRGPGDRIDIRPGQQLRFRARARSQGELESLQLIVNGEVVAQRAGQGAREVVLEQAVRFDRSSWAAVRVFERSDRSEVFAHTSPLYFFLGGKPVVVPKSVEDLLQKIDQLIAHTERIDGFRQEDHRKET
jgi:TolB protein